MLIPFSLGTMTKEPIYIYFESKTGNVRRFVNKLADMSCDVIIIDINSHEHFENKGHLVSYTTASGQIPIATSYFVEHYFNLLLSVSSSGNRNFGKNFGVCADKISERFLIDIGAKFELSGTDRDIERMKDFIEKFR